MRFALIIFVTILVAFNASWLLWRDRLTPTTLMTLPKPPTTLQRQFGPRLTAPLAAALERPLPVTFKAEGGLRLTLDRLREVAGVEIVANWATLERRGGVDESAPVTANMAGRPLRDALAALLAAVPAREPIGVEADGGTLIIDLQSQLGRTVITRVYDVRDVLPPTSQPAALNAAAGQLMTGIEASVASGTWRTPQKRRIGSLQQLSGQLVVTHTPAAQYDVAIYLNDLRLARARRDFAKRTSGLIGASVAGVFLIATTRRLLRRRAARRAGLCRRCGYDLRASEGRCPECGTEFAPAALA